GMLNGFFLLTAQCGVEQPCPPFWANWPDNQAEIDIEFVPGFTSSGQRPLISNGTDCSADNTNCNANFIGTVTPPRNFVSFNIFAKNSAGETKASNHQAFYELSSTPFGARNTYTIYYTPCGIQWSVASEQGNNPLLYQNSAHLGDSQGDIKNFIHTVDFDNLRGKNLNIYLNYFSGLGQNDFAGRQTPPANTQSDVHSVQFFQIQGGNACSTPTNPVAGAACSIDNNNKITCNYSGNPSFKSDFQNGVFELNGNPVNSWTDLWINVNFGLFPIYTDTGNAVYNGTGNPLELHFRCP
ncbi:MAG: hypothetical protein ACRENW_06915, partial [Thermodesulfobacteriota bacterium]